MNKIDTMIFYNFCFNMKNGGQFIARAAKIGIFNGGVKKEREQLIGALRQIVNSGPDLAEAKISIANTQNIILSCAKLIYNLDEPLDAELLENVFRDFAKENRFNLHDVAWLIVEYGIFECK